MGKHFSIEHADDQLEDNHPGCMWGVLHAFDYHQWHYVKKMLPHRKNDGGRHAKRNRSSKTRLNVHYSSEGKKILDAESSCFLVDQSTKETSSTNKRSLKARRKALVTEDISKEEDLDHKRRSRFCRTYSIHHLEASDYGLDKINTNWIHPIIFLHDNADTSETRLQDPVEMKATDKPIACSQKFDVCGTEKVMDCLEHNLLAENHTLSQQKCDEARETSVNQKLVQANQLRRNASPHQLKEYMDVLELFQVNKDLYQKILQNTDDGTVNCFHSLQTSDAKARLAKSGSFPVAGLSRSGNFRSSNLKHKQNETWSFPKGEKLLAATQAPNLVASKFSKDLCTKSGPLMADDTGGNVLCQETRFSFLSSTQESDKQGSNKVVVPLKDNHQRIELAVNEGKNKSNCTSLDALSGGVSLGHSPSPGQKEMAEWKESTLGRDGKDGSCSSHGTDGSVYDLRESTLTHVRRTSSLSESLDRYTRLFEYNFSREVKWHLSKSLKLTKEYEIRSSGHAPISHRRIHSLPHLDFHSSLQNEESHDSQFSGMPIMNVLDSSRNIESNGPDEPNPVGISVSAEKYVQLDANEETESLHSIVERSDINPRVEYSAILTVGINGEATANMNEEMDELTVGKSNSHREPEKTVTDIASNNLPQPNPDSVPESYFQEQVTSLVEFPISEGLECRFFDQKKSSINSLNGSDIDFLPESCSMISTDNFENANKSLKNHKHIELYTEDDADFNYVREILERSGFTGNGFHGTWYSSDQPLNPSLFEELEACWSQEPEYCGEDISSFFHRQLLFDLVDEMLLNIYERKFTYYPRALSSSWRTHPMSTGCHVLEEVWASIGRSLCLKPELDQSLDIVMAQDLAKDDGWMNLQWESECVALDLEDLIFDKLLEEVLFS